MSLNLEDWEDWDCARAAKSRPKRASKIVSSAQLLRATAWLEGELSWREGALHWGEIAPDAARIEAAGRALDTLERRDAKNETVAKRRRNWRLAHQLGDLEARDLDVLCAVSRARNPLALARLAPLLVVEALGVELPHSPARALMGAWPYSQTALESVARDESWPQTARELAAFCIGVADAVVGEKLPRALRGLAVQGARLKREIGDLKAPALLLEAARQGEQMAHRFAALLESEAPFAPDALALRRLVKAHGWERAWQIGTQLGAVEETWPLLPVFPTPETPQQAQLARETRVIWRRAGRDWARALNEFLPELALRAPDALDAFLELSRVWRDAARLALEHPTGPKKRAFRLPHSVEGAAFIAIVTAQMPTWSVHLARQTLGTSDVAGCLQLWCEVARRILNDAPAAHAHRSGRRAASLGWFDVLKRRFEREAMPLLALARRGGAPFARLIWQRGHHHQLARGIKGARLAPARVQSWVELVSELPIDDLSLRTWHRLCRRLEAAGTRPALNALLDATRVAPRGARARIIEGLRWSVPSVAEARALWPHLPAVMREVAAPLGQWKNDRIANMVDSLFIMIRLCHRWGVPAQQWPALARALLELYGPLETTASSYKIDDICRIVLPLCCADNSEAPTLETDFRATLTEALRLLPDPNDLLDKAAPGAALAQNRPRLARALRCGLAVAPQRALNALEHLAALGRAHQLDTLQSLEQTAPLLDQRWDEIIALAPNLSELARDHSSWSADAAPPSGALKVMEWPRKWAREIEALQLQIAAKPGLETRLNNLRARLADETKWRAQQQTELAELLRNATARAAFAALERAIESAFRARLETLCGELPAEFAFDDDWFNALLLAGEIESNRKWARALLRFEAHQQSDWREQLPGNARFLEALSGRGADVHFYLSEFGRARGALWLWLETTPLGVLQMGNRFGTCLSRGGCNAFSGIANAIELNKRVVYARDKKGDIVARQLWAVSESFELVGFDVYSTLPETEREGLEALFAAHAREFARGCGLSLADAGQIENLVAPQWYDDGIRAWEKTEEEVLVGAEV